MLRRPRSKRRGPRAVRHRRRFHLYLPGVLFVGATLFVLLGALQSGNNLLYWILGVSIGIVIVSGVMSGISLMGLRIEAYAPEPSTAGASAVMRYRLVNTNRLMPAVALSLTDVTLTAPKDDRLRAAGWARSIPPRTTLDVQLHARPTRRGRWTFDGLRASTTYPFGLTKKSVLAVQPRDLLVRPRPAPIQSSALLGPMGGGLRTRRTNAHLGIRGEPYGLREYVPGDPLRAIAWKASARTGDLRVTEETLPTDAMFRVAFRLSPSASDEFADAAVELAAGVCLASARAGIGVEIEGVENPTGRVDELLDALAELDPRDTGTVPSTEGTVVISDTAGGRSDVVLDVAGWAAQRGDRQDSQA